jgi:cation:H+ antiporter
VVSAVVQFVLAAGVIIAAGAFLTRAADRIAELTGFGRLLIGAVLLAGATSLPELSVDVSAAVQGLDNIAVGDLLGSSLFNLLILAVADLLHTQHGRMLSRASAGHAIAAAMSVLLTAIVGVMIVGRSGVSAWGVGVGSVAVFGAYVLGVRVIFYDQRLAREKAEEQGILDTAGTGRGRALRGAGVMFAAAAGAIVAAAPFVSGAAGRIAELSGLGGTFVGTTLVAASTSLPELVATIAAVRMGAYDLALGNIFGSNAFNMAMLLPVDIASRGPLLSTVSPAHALTAFWVVIITSVAVIGQLYHVEKRKRLLEPDALMVIALVVVALASLYRQNHPG